MHSWVNDGSAVWLFVVGAGVLGGILSPAAEVAIARFLPRAGIRPSFPVQITTAAVTIAICAAFALRFGVSPELPAFIFFAVLGVQLARTDIALHILPNPLVLALLAGGFLLLTPVFVASQTPDVLRAMLGAGILFAVYLFLGLISPEAIGMGDVKLAAPVGLYLGYLGWTQLLYGGLLGFILNGLIALVLVAKKTGNRATEMAHGPSMLAATVVVALLLA